MKKHIRKLFLVFMLVGLSACATVPPRPVGMLSLKDICARYHIPWEWDNVSQVVTIGSGNARAKGLIGSNVVLVGLETIYLKSPLEREQNVIVVPVDFEEKVIKRLFDVRVGPVVQARRIVIDPGHGGRDPGAISITGVYEKEIAFDIAKRVEKILERKGFEIIMTRGTDEYISLGRRTEIASRERADLFVSIHANSSTSQKPRGVEIYALRALTYEEEREEQRRRNRWLFINELSMRKDHENLKQIIDELLARYKKSETPRLSEHLVRSMSVLDSAKRPSSRHAGFFVIRNTLVPAVLVEVGYLSNREEEARLRQPSYRQQVADAIAQGIVSYANF